MSVFDWRGPAQTAEKKPEPKQQYPQLAYYWRKKAGLTGTRQNPVRGWREK